MCQYQPLSQNEFAGPPKELPPLLTGGDRFDTYMSAVASDAKPETLWRAFCDLGQRVAKATTEFSPATKFSPTTNES